jgi:perosamine synthetase
MRVSEQDLVYADFSSRVLRALGIDDVIKPLPLHEPYIGKECFDEVNSVLESGFVSSVGSAVNDFERALVELTGVRNAVTTSSGTSALQLALKLVGVNQGDHVAVPNLSFIATANAVSFLGAKPVFVDTLPAISGSTMSMSPVALEQLVGKNYVVGPDGPVCKLTNARLAAIVPVHVFGRLGELDEIRKWAGEWNIPVIEDAAEALGSFDTDGEHPGSVDIAILSFNGNKVLTSGGGGALLTNSDQLASRARYLSTTAKKPHNWRFSHDEIGWNFRLPAINAALGLGQMRAISKILFLKQRLYERYRESFQGSPYFEFLDNPRNQNPNNWLIAVKIKTSMSHMLEEVINKAHSEGLLIRPFWDTLSTQLPYIHNLSTDMTNSNEARSTVICLPSSPILAEN